MEAVFVLSEIGASAAADELARVLDDSCLPSELRAAAAWGLGIAGRRQPDRLVPFIGDQSDEVALHSVVALGRQLSMDVLEAVAMLMDADDRRAAAAASVLARNGPRGAEVLLARATTGQAERARAWARYGLGLLGRAAVATAAGGRLPTELEVLMEPLWLGLTENWLAGDIASSLAATDQQALHAPDPGQSTS